MSLPPDADAFRSRALSLLGPASAEWLAAPEGHLAVLATLARGKDLDSALLAEAERRGRDDAAVKGEFLACIMGKMRSMGRGNLSAKLRRYYDTIDIVQSVAGDVFAEGDLPDFEDLGSFLALLRQRLRWKAADHARRLEAEKRSEGQRDGRPIEDLSLAGDGGDPAAEGQRAEFVVQLQQALTELSERDQQLLRLYMAGQDIDALAGRVGLNRASAGRALRRAKDRLRQQFE